MANEVNLNLDPRGFLNIMPKRTATIQGAPDTPPPSDYPVNRLMRAFHPVWQHVKISKVLSHGADAKSYVLVPDEGRGTETLAYFSAGQYVCVYLAIGDARVLRPYSLRSAPSDALKGRYTITVKRTADGFASRFILESWKAGDSVTLTGPEGFFSYEPLRDAEEIVALAGGSGITPFYSLAAAIADGTEKCRLTLLYGSRRKQDILLEAEFNALAAKSDKIKVVHVLSDEPTDGYEYGMLTAGLIKKYAPPGDYSLFMCGPQAMYTFCEKEIDELHIPRRLTRREAFGEIKHPEEKPGYPGTEDNSFTLRVVVRGEARAVPCTAGESLLSAMERAGIPAPSRCRSGECGFCRSKLLSGSVFIAEAHDGRRLADMTYHYIHPCITFPLDDISLEVPGEPVPL